MVQFEITEDFIPSRKPQILASCIATFGAFGLGSVLGWSAPALPNLKKSGELGILTSSQRTWIASIVAIGALAAGPITGLCLQKIGRRQTLLCMAVPLILSWILISCSTDVILMCVGRFITGLCGGAFYLAVPVYVSEIADKDIQGVLEGVHVLMIQSGILFSYVTGAYVNWMWLTILCATVPMLFVCCMIYMPETPQFFLTQGKPKTAASSLKWLRGASDDYDVKLELIRMKSQIEEASSNKSSCSIKDLCSPTVLKPISIVLGLHFLQQCSLINVFLFYAVDIFKMTKTDFDPYISAIIFGVCHIMTALLSICLVDRVGRNILLGVSSIGSAVALTVLGTFFFLKERNDNNSPELLQWLPLTTLVFYIIFYGIGLGPLPCLLMRELLPSNSKELTVGLIVSLQWIVIFIVTKTFEDLTHTIGVYGPLWFFAGILFLGSVFSCIFVPATKKNILAEVTNNVSNHSTLERMTEAT